MVDMGASPATPKWNPPTYENAAEELWAQVANGGELPALLPNDTNFLDPNYYYTGGYNLSNVTNNLVCKLQHANVSEVFQQQEGVYCNALWDTIMCWPPTPVNSTAYLKCFSEFLGFKYDDSQNASKSCLSNGTWSKSDYSFCAEIPENVTSDGTITSSTIYFVGYSLSLIALTIAIAIFICFKDLRCLRNTIHTNLMCAYILDNFMWILTLIVENTFENDMIPCVFLVLLLHYFHVTIFFWMFVEGLYLYILVVETLTRENFKLKVYLIIGWGLPMLFIFIWAVTKAFIDTDPMDVATNQNAENLFKNCPWIKPHFVDWIFQGPITAVLTLNSFFLIAIMWVLITKLRSANTLETQQYRKAAKALLVLKPLLGVTYVLTIAGPTAGPSQNIFDYARAVLLSLQGFIVALFYCFLNTEVQNTVKHHWENWRANKTLGPSRTRKGSRSKDWSPRSRTESIRDTEWTVVNADEAMGNLLCVTHEFCGKACSDKRLYSYPMISYQKRESSASEMTTTTLIATTNGGTRTSNGSGNQQPRSPFLQPPKNV